ncbi:SRPBCC family protein [Candidatus Woesearchaeota archaeon]|nr:SRPBCC family protein [Candidatus Woesearchaeota archaeon]
MVKTTFKSRHIGVSVNCPAKKAYKFASNPENLPKWASGLSSSIKKADGELIAESPMGKIKIKFANKNKFGILDHDVTLPSGERVYNPMRVFTNNRGSEFVFTIYQKTGMSGKMFEDDAKLVKKDLEKLKELLEKSQT